MGKWEWGIGAWGMGHGAWGIGHGASGMGHRASGIGHWALGLIYKKVDNAAGVFLLPIIKADKPAKKLNAGAQKLVINRVKNWPGGLCCIGWVKVKCGVMKIISHMVKRHYHHHQSF